MAPIFVLALGLGTAVVTDMRTRRIPNWLTAGMASAGFGIAVGGGHVTPTQAALGMLIGLLLMLPGHVIGATGAGDVKLMAAVGAVVGTGLILSVFLYTVIAGGVLAVFVALRRRRLRQTVIQTTKLVMAPTEARATIQASDRTSRFAYGPAIAVGTLLTLVVNS